MCSLVSKVNEEMRVLPCAIAKGAHAQADPGRRGYAAALSTNPICSFSNNHMEVVAHVEGRALVVQCTISLAR